jgi:hypothetical protein
MSSWRPFTWVILALQVPFAVWLIGALVSPDKTSCPEANSRISAKRAERWA